MTSENSLVPYHAVHILGKGPVVVLAPHPDDEVLGCAGAIMRHIAAGDRVAVVILTDGGGFHADGPERDAYVAQRRQESRAAAVLLGYGEPQFWGYRDRELSCDSHLVQRLCTTVVTTGARWLYAPSPCEIHPDHRTSGLAALAVVRRLSEVVTLALYEIGAPLPPNRLLDISDLLERKHQAMACFPSQLSNQAYDRHIEALNRYRTYTLPATVTAAEAYWVITGDEALDGPRMLAVVEQQVGLAEVRSHLAAEQTSISPEPRSLLISIVVHAPDLALLATVLERLGRAVHHARQSGQLTEARLILVDNGPGLNGRELLGHVLSAVALPVVVEVLSGQGNVGYGAGHNLALQRSDADLHLILNPDVLLEEDALSAGLEFLAAHPEAGLVAPAAWDKTGQRQYLCKRYPTVLDLALRGFAPSGLRRRFQIRLDRYELRDQTGDAVFWDPTVVSGCFMLGRRVALVQVGGFRPEYFLYFEDFDLSLRLAAVTRLAHVPQIRIVHLGGHTARKGVRHIGLFLRAAVVFFHQHGWRWW